jgi:hypothetical protein
MGYYSKFRGELIITSNESYPEELVIAAKNTGYELPVINGLSKEGIKELKSYDDFSFFFDISATKIKPVGEEGSTREDIIQRLVSIIESFQGIANGEIIRIGEEQGDLERFTVVDNVITIDRAQMVWVSDNVPVSYELYQL